MNNIDFKVRILSQWGLNLGKLYSRVLRFMDKEINIVDLGGEID
jgi:hypothetical protein